MAAFKIKYLISTPEQGDLKPRPGNCQGRPVIPVSVEYRYNPIEVNFQ